MHQIDFRVRHVSTDSGAPDARTYRIVEIAVDRRHFLDLVRKAEAPFAAAEGHRGLAGKYEGLPAESVLPPARHFWGKPSVAPYRYRGKVSLYECECGCPGCWPLLARISVKGQKVTWSDFEQPHRGPRSRASWWRYDDLGPFVFDRAEYEVALARAAATLLSGRSG